MTQPSLPPPVQSWPSTAPTPAPLRDADERTWGTLAHALALPAMFVAMAFLAPLLVLLLFGQRSAWVRRQAVESLNFQITGLLVFAGLVVVSVVTLGIGLLATIPLGIAYGIFWIVAVVLATAAANRGEDYRYPLTIRFVS